jgi:hypothetical protein
MTGRNISLRDAASIAVLWFGLGTVTICGGALLLGKYPPVLYAVVVAAVTALGLKLLNGGAPHGR